MSMKVLVVDPDWRFTREAVSYLESHAHLVASHPVAQKALEHAESWKPDLVILAAELAETDLLEQIYRIHPRPAVLLTEHMDRYDRAWRAWQKGGDELLMKPVFSNQELHQAIVIAMENAVSGAIIRPVSVPA